MSALTLNGPVVPARQAYSHSASVGSRYPLALLCVEGALQRVLVFGDRELPILGQVGADAATEIPGPPRADAVVLVGVVEHLGSRAIRIDRGLLLLKTFFGGLRGLSFRRHVGKPDLYGRKRVPGG